MLRKNFFSKNFEALHRNSAKRYGDRADEIFAGVEACNASMGASSFIPRQMQHLIMREDCVLLVQRVGSSLGSLVDSSALNRR